MKKQRLFLMSLLFALFMIPAIVSAKTYDYNEIRNQYYNGENPSILFKKGDSISFSNCNYQTYIYLEEIEDNKCYGNFDNCTKTYTLNNDAVMQTIYDNSIILFRVENNANVNNFSDLQDGHVYKSGDVVFNSSSCYDAWFPMNTDNTCNYIVDYEGYSYFYRAGYASNNYCILEGVATKLPKYGNKDIMWKLTIVDGRSYSPHTMVFEPFEYKTPEFKLKCNKDIINYGEKASCSVTATSVYKLEDVAFDLTTPNFKVSNPKGSDKVQTVTGNKEFNFRITSNEDLTNKEFVLMTFDLEAAKNEVYADDVSVTNIAYVDELYEGEYEVIKSDLRVVTSKNPKTYRNTVLLLLPIIILVGTMVTLKFRGEKKKKI